MRDLFGRHRAAQNGNPIDAPVPYQVDISSTEASGVTTTIQYIRFFNTTPCGIQRKTIVTQADDSSLITLEFAYADW